MGPFSKGLTHETPIEYKASILAVQIRCLKEYPGQYHVKHFIDDEKGMEIILLSNKKIKDIKVELETSLASDTKRTVEP